MHFKRLLAVTSFLLASLTTFSSSAELVRLPGTAGTDNHAVSTLLDVDSGVTWLPFNYTYGKTYAQVFYELERSLKGFRFATNSEVEQLFSNQFDAYGIEYKTASSTKYVNSSAIVNFEKLSTYGAGDMFTRGLYYDEDGILRMAGISRPQINNTNYLTVYGLESDALFSYQKAYLATSYFLVKAEPGDTIYSLNDPVNNPNWAPTTSIFDTPAEIPAPADVPAPFAPILFALPMLFAFRRQERA